MPTVRRTNEAGLLGEREKSVTKRMIIMLVLVAIVLGGIIGFNVFKGIMIKKYMASAPQPPATVTMTKAEVLEWQPELTAVGTMRAVRGVDVTTEIAGLVRSVEFKSGGEAKSGQLLVQLNADSDLAQLQALKAQADLAKTVLDRDRAQLAVEAVSKAQVDADEADLKNKHALADQQQAVIDKKTLRAPFGGRLGITTVNPGQYLNPGDKVVTLQTIDPIYIDFYLPQQDIAGIAAGQTVHVTSDAFAGEKFAGKITAIDPKIDITTRNVQVEATIENAKRELLPGMFGRASVEVGEKQHYLTLPQTAITYNPYGATVFIAKPNGSKDTQGNPVLVAQQAFVTTGPTRGDQVAVLKGVDAGMDVVTSGQLKLKTGTVLIIDNHLQPTNDINPTPQEH